MAPLLVVTMAARQADLEAVMSASSRTNHTSITSICTTTMSTGLPVVAPMALAKGPAVIRRGTIIV
jgi:hypothetical protein